MGIKSSDELLQVTIDVVEDLNNEYKGQIRNSISVVDIIVTPSVSYRDTEGKEYIDGEGYQTGIDSSIESITLRTLSGYNKIRYEGYEDVTATKVTKKDSIFSKIFSKGKKKQVTEVNKSIGSYIEDIKGIVDMDIKHIETSVNSLQYLIVELSKKRLQYGVDTKGLRNAINNWLTVSVDADLSEEEGIINVTYKIYGIDDIELKIIYTSISDNIIGEYITNFVDILMKPQYAPAINGLVESFITKYETSGESQRNFEKADNNILDGEIGIGSDKAKRLLEIIKYTKTKKVQLTEDPNITFRLINISKDNVGVLICIHNEVYVITKRRCLYLQGKTISIQIGAITDTTINNYLGHDSLYTKIYDDYIKRNKVTKEQAMELKKNMWLMVEYLLLGFDSRKNIESGLIKLTK